MTTETPAQGRIVQLDRLRGIAILGIFFMNIPFMANSADAYLAGRVDLMGWTPIDRLFFFLQDVLAEGTARGMLEMLFGAGMVLLTARLARTTTGWGSFKAYYRRYILLFLFGVFHIFALLWVGDILSIYGPAALLLYWFRNRSAKTMLICGLLIAPIFFTVSFGAKTMFTPDRTALVAAGEANARAGRPVTEAQRAAIEARDERVAEERADAAELRADMAVERAARLGSFSGYVQWTHAAAIEFLGKGFHIFMVLEALATMLIGAALFRWGVLSGERSTRETLAITGVAYAVGLGLRVPMTLAEMDVGGPGSSFDFAQEIARLAMVIGHVGLIALAARSGFGRRLLAPFAEAGRVALSLYFLQTIVGMWIVFPGFGLGLWGQLGWAGMMIFAAAYSLVQLAIAHVYLKRWRTGPVEWLWRTLSGARPGTRAPDGVPAAA